MTETTLTINSLNDINTALELALSSDNGALLLDESQLGENFFELRTGLAGEFFQKFTNYRIRLAIVVLEPEKYGARFTELAREHKTHPTIRFHDSVGDAELWLSSPAIVVDYSCREL